MLCEKCKKGEATGVYESTHNGVKTIIHLCTRCLWEKQNKFLDSQSELFGDFDMFSGFVGMPSQQKLRCKTCGNQLSQINKTLFVGCPDCYSHLAEQLNPVIKNIQGATAHVGSSPVYSVGKFERGKSEIVLLKEQLASAIKNERYEDAVVLHNRLKSLEDVSKSNGYNGLKGDN